MPQQRERRELVAATFGLEAARADEWNEWKLIQPQPAMSEYQPPGILYWKPPPLLIEWGCERLSWATLSMSPGNN